MLVFQQRQVAEFDLLFREEVEVLAEVELVQELLKGLNLGHHLVGLPKQSELQKYRAAVMMDVGYLLT